MRRLSTVIVALVSLCLAACGDETQGPANVERGAMGKADQTGSCTGFCGTQSADGCWCDSECSLYGDCCADRDQECKGGPAPGCSVSGPIDALCGTICDTGYQVVGGQTMCTCCAPTFCGGIAGLPCPAGFTCKLDGSYPDAGGKCVVKGPTPCPPVLCQLYCENGFELDENGCAICKCKQPACPPVMCELYCEDGFELDANGCEICKCKQPERQVASGMCVKNSFESCSSDADCVAGGCGGELCYNPAFGGGVSTCECVQPSGVSCGCVNGTCAWWN